MDNGAEFVLMLSLLQHKRWRIWTSMCVIPSSMVETHLTSVQLGDLHSLISDRSIEIINDLQQMVFCHQQCIVEAAQGLAELDW